MYQDNKHRKPYVFSFFSLISILWKSLRYQINYEIVIVKLNMILFQLKDHEMRQEMRLKFQWSQKLEVSEKVPWKKPANLSILEN